MKYPDPWDTYFGFYWYNDDEIFRSSQKDLDAQAESHKENGINHVITFSSTHFRWSFRRYWHLLNDVLSMVVEACHKHGIAVTEHHSSHLTFNPIDKADIQYMERVLNKRNSSLGSWPLLLEDCYADPLIDGVPLSSLRQIDGRTGNWARSNYHGWGFCFNNPVYRRYYLRYLQTVYETGVDGIMTDDVQYFGMDDQRQSHACACPYCRAKFLQETGYSLPRPGEEWNNWYGNYADPSFPAFLHFKTKSTRDFHVLVKEHYESLNLRPLRPNYQSNVLVRNPTAYCLETVPDLDWIFQENCFSHIIRYSWPNWMVEARHRFAVGRRRGIPSMSLFYPDREDTVLFTWALSKTWGQMYLATPEGGSADLFEKPLRKFETGYGSYLKNTEIASAIAFYDSRMNRQIYEHAESRSLPQMKTWMQALLFRNIPVDIVQAEDKERFKNYEIIILNETAIITDGEITALKDYVAAGGKLIWTGRTGALRGEDFTEREVNYVQQLWGEDAPGIPEDGSIFLEHPVGKGKVFFIPGDIGLGPFWTHIQTDRFRTKTNRVPVPGWSRKEWDSQNQIVLLLRSFLKEDPAVIETLAPGSLQSMVYYTSRALMIQLTNTQGALPPAEGETGSHEDPVPFTGFPEKAEPWQIKVKIPHKLRKKKAESIRLLVPEKEPMNINGFSREKGYLKITFPPSKLEWYGLIAADFV
ncbi:MAG: beta-galactosidase trimerization domain-containing protein [Spirochaetia bacterium]